jgi:hypothetical protein
MLFCMQIDKMAKTKLNKKHISDNDIYGKNVRIPLNEFNIIKKYVDAHNYKLGGFIAAAAIEKIQRDQTK